MTMGKISPVCDLCLTSNIFSTSKDKNTLYLDILRHVTPLKTNLTTKNEKLESFFSASPTQCVMPTLNFMVNWLICEFVSPSTNFFDGMDKLFLENLNTFISFIFGSVFHFLNARVSVALSYFSYVLSHNWVMITCFQTPCSPDECSLQNAPKWTLRQMLPSQFLPCGLDTSSSDKCSPDWCFNLGIQMLSIQMPLGKRSLDK